MTNKGGSIKYAPPTKYSAYSISHNQPNNRGSDEDWRGEYEFIKKKGRFR